MPALADVLKSAGIAEDVIKGLPTEVIGHVETFYTQAESKLTAAQQAEQQAAELRRQAELDKKEVTDYVENYGTDLTKMASVNAQLAARTAYLKKMKEQGFEVPDDLIKDDGSAKPTTPEGTVNLGGFDPAKFRGEVGSVMAQFIDASNEHMRLYGTPLPESSTSLAQEAARAHKPIGDYIAEKFKFKAKGEEIAKAARDKEVEDRVNARLTEERRKEAEKRGSNPNLIAGESSRNSFVPKIKADDFQKASGNIPARERHRRMLQNIHAEMEQTA